jgi:hypothetical protein
MFDFFFVAHNLKNNSRKKIKKFIYSIYCITFGCKVQIHRKKQIPQIVNIVTVRRTIAKISIENNEYQSLIDHILGIIIIWLLTSEKSY